MLLIENHVNETDEALRIAIDKMLSCVWDPPQSGWWDRYELGRIFEYSSRRYREFSCPAGSVGAQLISRATTRVMQRVLITIGVDENGEPTGHIISNSQSESFNPVDVSEVLAEPT